MPRKRPRKRIVTGRPRPNAPTGTNQVWSYDFVFDWCANGQQLKCLTVTDDRHAGTSLGTLPNCPNVPVSQEEIETTQGFS